MKQTIAGLVVILLVACSGAEYQTPPSGPIESAVPIPSEAARSVTVATNTPFLLTPTLEPTSVVIPALHDLPSWLKNPDPNVLAALITDDPKRVRNIAFFNTVTQERYEIPMPKDTSGFFWYDNMNFGFLSKDLKTAYQINLETGEVSSEAISPHSTRLLDKDWVNGLVRFQETDNEFVFDKVLLPNTSKNKSFTAWWGGDQNIVVVTDTITDQVIWESAAIKNVWVTGFTWSPTNNNLLAFIQGSPKPESSDYVTEDISLTIVDVTTGEIISTYSGDFGGIQWSPDGRKILYLDPLVHYSNYGIPFQHAPCILFLQTGEKRCLRAVPLRVPEGYKLQTTYNYEWGINSETISYAYAYGSLAGETTLGNLCIYSLVDDHITCPTQKLEALQNHVVGIYNISPNQEYIHFCYWDKNLDVAYDGIINFDGQGFFSWSGAIHCSLDTLWRPLP